MSSERFLSWLWQRLGDLSLLSWLFSLAGSFSVTTWIVSILPSGWYAPGYWAAAGTAFFGTMFAVVAAVQWGPRGWRWAKRRWGPKPRAEVTIYSGQEAVLAVHNVGGDGEFEAEGKILHVIQGVQRHHAPYRMRWRDPQTHKIVDGHRVLIRADAEMRMILARYLPGDWSTCIEIVGDNGAVDRTCDDRGSPDTIYVLEIRISATPSLEEQTIKHYLVRIAPGGYHIEAHEHQAKTPAAAVR